MEAIELLEIIAKGEDSKHQFKAEFTKGLAAEMVAFSNSGGGIILLGVRNNGSRSGLTREDVDRFNQLVSNAASQEVHPPVNPSTENIAFEDGLVMVISIPAGISKPYMDNAGAVWVKNGSDKRKVTSREEMQRMFQDAGLIHGDEVPANGLTISDLDMEYFRNYFEKEYGESIENSDIPLSRILENTNLARNGNLNVAGALLFAQRPQYRLPLFIIKAIAYPGTDIHGSQYLDSEDLTGKLGDVFQKALGFVTRNLRHVQGDQTVNSVGVIEIPRIVLEELLVNALVHRDYFISAPIRIFIFSDRVEIINPGHLSNNLSIENIKNGNSNIRNPILVSFATRILPYRGLGNGIRRALKEYPDIDFFEDKAGSLFKVIIRRPNI